MPVAAFLHRCIRSRTSEHDVLRPDRLTGNDYQCPPCAVLSARIFYAALLLAILWVNYAEASTLTRNNSATGMSIDAVAQLSYQFFVTFAFAQLARCWC